MVDVVECRYSFVFVTRGGRQSEQDTMIPRLSSMALLTCTNLSEIPIICWSDLIIPDG